MDLHQEFIQAIEDGNKVIFDLKNRVDHLETKDAKANRPHFGGGGEDFSLDATAHKAAFRKYLCKGESQGLSELQSKAMSVGSGNDGGYTVPKIIDSMLENLAVNISPIRAISTVVQCSTQDYHKLVNLRGTQSGWVGESESRPLTNTPQLADIAPPFGEIFCNLSATQQMLDDSFFNAEQWLAENAATEFARAEGQAMVSGNGINQPVGFLFKPTSATPDGVRAFGTLEHVATGVSGAFKTLTSTVNPVDDLFTLVGKLKAEYRKDACFVMNKATLFQVTSFKDYQGRYVFNPTTAPGQPDTLLGYPIYEAEDMPGIAANSASIAFGNFKRGYLVVDRIGTRVLRDPFSAKPAVTFYITKRLAGCIQNSECIKILKFSTT